MRRLLLLAAVSALGVARPESYKEKEDFQYSRSSSDDGTKSGFYGAQRGNMGGNYERAHNMDTLAQHQLGGLVKQVEGELGDGSKTRTGSVYSAANSRGIYGSGRYDLSSLEGRNFQEGVTYDDSQSHSSLTSHNSGYSGQSYDASNSAGFEGRHAQGSRYHGYQAAGHSDHTLQSNNLEASSLQTRNQQALNSIQGSNQYDYDRRASHNTGYHTNTDVYGQSVYDQSNSNLRSSSGYGSNGQTRYVATPVRIVVTPGTRVAIPISAQNIDSTSYGQNAVNSDAEVLRSNSQQTIYQPSSEPKHYESSYSYRKEWEKHDTKPVAVPLAMPTVYPLPKNSELYEDIQSQATDNQFEANRLDTHAGGAQSSNAYSGYHSNVNSASSSQTQRQSNYNAQHQSSSLGMDQRASTHGGYNLGTAISSTNHIDNLNTRPKSYESSYSYHKSWERQGDPYVIKPASNGLDDGQSSQKLTAELNNQGAYASHQHGSHYHQSNQRYASSNDDCDEEGHVRVARSYNVARNQEETPYQQSQNIYEGQEDLGQQTQNGWQNYEDVGQQSQNKWENIEDLGQQPQNKWDNLEILGQQTQNLGDVGQQIQNKWDKLEDLGQQAQNQFDQQDVGQETQNTWDKLELSQQSQTDLGQHTQETWNTMETGAKEHTGGHTFEIRENTVNLGQQTQDLNKEAQTQEIPEGVPFFNTFNLHEHLPETQSVHDEVHGLSNIANQDIQTTHQNTFTGGRVEYEPIENIFSQQGDLSQQTQDSWKNVDAFNQNTYIANKPIWERTAESTKQDSLNADSEINSNQNNFYYNHDHSKHWTYGLSQHHHDVDLDRQIETHGNQYWNTYSGINREHSWQAFSNNNNNFYSQSHSSSESPLSSLWNKIDSFEKQLSDNTANSHIPTSQDSNHNLEQIHTANNNNSVITQTLKQNQFTSNTVNATSQHNTFTAGTSTTEKTKEGEPILHNEDKLRPLDIGRGDIGPEDAFTDISITEQSFNLFNNKLNSSDNIRAYKTPSEIEFLSLTNQTRVINKLHNKTENTNKYNINQNNYQQQQNNNKFTEFNNELSVLSLNEQKRIENQMPHELPSSSTVRTLRKNDSSMTNYSDFKSFIGQRQNKTTRILNDKIDLNEKQNSTQEDTKSNTFFDIQHNIRIDQNPAEIEPQNMDRLEGFGNPKVNYHQLNPQGETGTLGQENGSLNGQNMEQQFEQQSESFNQQREGFGQQSESLGQQIVDFGQPSEQFEDLFDFGQHNEKLDQQSQTSWSENLEGLNQQVETASNLDSNLQDTDTAQQHPGSNLEILEQQSQTAWIDNLEDLNQQVQTASKPNNIQQETNTNQQQPDQQIEVLEQQDENLDQQSQTAWSDHPEDFNQQLQTASNNLNPQYTKNVETPPDVYYKEHHSSSLDKHNSQNTDKSQSVTQKNPVVEIPPETATEKPGFWKSVGNKFVGAKDKVFSWFGSSS